LPLVVFAHGWNSDPAVYQVLLDQWAEAGFLVAAPIFPDSTDLYPGAPVSDYSAQALDVSFVITQLLDGVASPVKADGSRIAVAGHSDGGTDVALLALDPYFADHRVRSFLCLAGEMPTGVGAYAIAPSSAGLFVAVGTADEYGLASLSPQVFQSAQMPKVMMTEQGGTHLGSFLSDTTDAVAMRNATVRFLLATLGTTTQSNASLATAIQPALTVGLSMTP
jgi:pimeloyl-ACP methyl ester carboxylesterase